jgi:dTDP-4-amino-4,6-dideoxygalactose transaminase
MIAVNDFRRLWEDTREDATCVFQETGASGWYILGGRVEEFEEAIATWWDTGFACGVASGLDAIEISLRILGCGPGDRVLTTPLSAFATTLAIVRCGAVPVFADTDAHGLIDLDLCRAILRNDEGIRYMVPVHLYGHALDSARLAQLRDDFNLRIVEDCAQSIGASFNGLPTGLAGQMAATSFYPTKNLGAMGDGGAILTADPALHAQVKMFRDYGQSAKYRHDVIGYNSRLDELQAALLGQVYLPRLGRWIARRREIASRYLEGIRNPAIRAILPPDGSESCWHLFPVTIEQKAGFLEHLRAAQIAGGEHYPVLIPAQKALGLEPVPAFPQALRISENEVSLPIHPYLRNDEVDRVIDSCNTWRPCATALS